MDDDEERSAGSQDGSSDNDGDETMRDVDDGDDQGDADMDGDNDGDADGDGDGDDEGDNEDEGDNQSEDASDNEQASGEQNANESGDPTQLDSQQDGIKKVIEISHPRPEVLSAVTYDIVPTIAAPQSTSINAICGTWDSRWIFTGGADGFIRQYNWVDSVNGKTQLTVAQRHPFVDSVVKAGVLVTYWENWDAKKLTPESSLLTTSQALSPVYSLAVHSQALWMVSGTASGAIRLQSVRHDEGKEIALLQKHTSAVSVLSISSDEKNLLSGSWDKSVIDWDLNTGQIKTAFAPSGGQISSIESRPISSIPVPFESGEIVKPTTTFSSNNAAPEQANGTQSSAPSPPKADKNGAATPDSLFGGDDGDDDLFGDGGNTALTNGNAFGFDESEMNTTADGGPLPDEAPPSGVLEDTEQPSALQPPPGSSPAPKESSAAAEPSVTADNGIPNTTEQPMTNGLPHAEDVESKDDVEMTTTATTDSDKPVTSDSTFMATSTDGCIRVWDRRQALPVARITPHDTPPWCLSACWSPDGNNIYAGRRNNTVEEYDLRKGLKRPERVFRFPQGSGAVTSVKAMPNGRHLICASYDILRLYDLKASATGTGGRSAVPFLIVPGHRTGTISHLYLSGDCRYMMTTGGNRGWEGQPTEVLLGYEIGVPKTTGLGLV